MTLHVRQIDEFGPVCDTVELAANISGERLTKRDKQRWMYILPPHPQVRQYSALLLRCNASSSKVRVN